MGLSLEELFEFEVGGWIVCSGDVVCVGGDDDDEAEDDDDISLLLLLFSR
jgi:hypothetical protein